MNIEYLLKLNEAAFDGICSSLKIGMSEFDIEKIIHESYRAVSEFPFSVEGDIIAGKRTSGIEGCATDNMIKSGDNIIVDVQPMIDGVFCDTTRTFFVGEPTDKMKDVYNAVKETLTSLENILKPGTVMSDIYFVMQDLLGEFGYSCPHHAGHLIGLNRDITPDFVPEESSVLKVGDLVALEPGVYIEKEFGIRLENNFIITETGCKNLFPYPLEIEKFIL